MYRYLLVGQCEVGILIGMVAHHRGLSVDTDAGDEHRAGTDAAQLVDERAGPRSVHAVCTVGGVGEIAGFCIVGISEMGHGHHLAHAVDGGGGHAIVQVSFITHDGVYKHRGALRGLLHAVVGHDACLTLRHDESRGDGVETETQLLPHRKNARDIVGGVQNVEFPIVECVRHKGCGQVVDGQSHIREDGQHGSRGHLAITRHIIDKKYLFGHTR